MKQISMVLLVLCTAGLGAGCANTGGTGASYGSSASTGAGAATDTRADVNPNAPPEARRARQLPDQGWPFSFPSGG